MHINVAIEIYLSFIRSDRGSIFEVQESLDNPELAFWGGVVVGAIFVSLLICLKRLGDGEVDGWCMASRCFLLLDLVS